MLRCKAAMPPTGARWRREVTAAERNVIHAPDGRPALDALETDIGDPARAGGDIHVALPVGASDTSDYLVRNLTRVDPQRGWIAAGDVVAVSDALMFCRRDRDAAEELAIVRRELGECPLIGMFCNGEISNNRLYGYTGVLALFV